MKMYLKHLDTSINIITENYKGYLDSLLKLKIQILFLYFSR